MVPRKVLVAVESAECPAALHAAAHEAMRRRCGVHVMHVLPPVYAGHPRIEELTMVAGELQHAGTTVVRDAAARLRELLPEELVVSTELRHGTIVGSLVEASAHACLLVLSHRSAEHGPGRLLSTTQAVSARAQCPVLAVPDTWHEQRTGHRPWVVVGVEDVLTSGRVAEAAMTEAVRRHAGLRVVHAAADRDAADMDAAAYGAWMRTLHRRLEHDLSGLLARHPDVPVELHVSPEPPEAALVSAAEDAALLVVGRGHGRIPVLGRPGPVTAHVLRHATAPVLVLDGLIDHPTPVAAAPRSVQPA